MVPRVRLLLTNALVESAFQGSSCHFQRSLIGLVAPDETTHMDKHTARNASFCRQFIVSHAPPLLWQSLSALEPVGSNSNSLHSPALAPLILQLCGKSNTYVAMILEFEVGMLSSRSKQKEWNFYRQQFNFIDLDRDKGMLPHKILLWSY